MSDTLEDTSRNTRARLSNADWIPSVKVTILAVAAALVVGAVLIALSEERVVESLQYFFSYPWDFFTRSADVVWSSYSALVSGSLGSTAAVVKTLERSAPLICAGLGVTLAFRAGLFNIGATGQLGFGALASGYVGFTWSGLPAGLHLVVALLAGLVAAAFWGGLVGFLKARTGAHEVITTIMFNYLAASILLYALSKDAFQREGSDNSLSPPVAGSAAFPEIGSLHLGVLLSFAAAFAVWWLLERSVFGFELKAVGANEHAARTAGMSTAKVYTGVMVLAGACAGLAATMLMLGNQNSLSPSLAGNIGFDAITVALLGRATPLGTVLAGLLFGALSVGGVSMQANVGTSKELTDVLQALIVLFVAAPALVQGLFRLRDSGGGAAVEAKGWGS